MTKIKDKFPLNLTLVVTACAVLFLLGLGLVSELKFGFTDSIQILIASLPFCGMTYLVLIFFAWLHYVVLISLFRKISTERLLKIIKLGTLAFVGEFEVFALSSMPNMNSTFSLILIYIPILCIVNFAVVLLITGILSRVKK